ncbi:MAG TPA: glucose-1-phosphate thymidylyltransferase [Polyangiaceae bacterium]|nr:glucose-1-phosphate thymidylyltransferase [Polyangiaceae bacterium]
MAGGTGTRLRPLTYSGAKQLVPVANRPILFYVLDNLAEAGIHDVVVIVSPETGREVQAALGDGSRWQARVTYIVQQHPGGLAHAVRVAAPALGQDDFCMFLGDNLIGTKIRLAADAFRASPDLSALLMLKEVPNPSSFGVAEVNAAGQVVGLVEKPASPKSNLALVGIYFFRPSVFAAIEKIRPSARGELEITDAISELIAGGGVVRFEHVTSWWLDTGKKDDLLLANDTVLDAWLAPATLGSVDDDSKIIGRVRVEPGARVVRSVVRGPAIIGEGATIVDSRIGPFTSIGPAVRVEGSVIDRCVIMEGSSVEGVERLEDSLVGRRVAIHRSARAGQTLSLLVGDDCRVEL